MTLADVRHAEDERANEQHELGELTVTVQYVPCRARPHPARSVVKAAPRTIEDSSASKRGRPFPAAPRAAQEVTQIRQPDLLISSTPASPR